LERVVQYSSGVNEDDELDNLHKLLKSKINTEEGKKREDYLNALNELSQGFRFLENYQKELRCVEDVLEKNENDWFANYIKSFVLGLQGEIYQAEIFNTKSLKKNPEFAEAWDHKCYLLTKIGDYEAALEAADNAIRLKGFDDSYTHKAIALLCLERYKEAEDTLNIACLISPHDYYPYYSFGKALYWNEKYIEAIMYLDRSLEKRNNFYGSYYYLSLVYKKIGNWEESEKNAILCLKFGNENNATAQCLLGEIYNGKKQYEDAVKQLEKAILLKGGWFPFGYLMLGITYYNWAKSLESEDVETIEKQITYLEASVKGFSDSISTKIDDLESAKRKKERSLLMLRGRKMILNQKI
jgi:tetratricopeptide (TPR) repeat protein